jgi:hypothetical protein
VMTGASMSDEYARRPRPAATVADGCSVRSSQAAGS